MPYPAGDTTASQLLCGPCALATVAGSISTWRAFARYEGSLRRIIHAFKYYGHRSLAVPLGRAMRIAGHDALLDAEVAVAVPLHALKQVSRGFNPAEDLAKHLGLRYLHALRRHRATRPQAGLDASARRANVRGAFSPSRRLGWRGTIAEWQGDGRSMASAVEAAARLSARWSVAGLVVVLVDDVRTTGATLDACARVLRAAGARDVRALTAAAVVRG
jgi:predicted amidophosphoribosyltransferase